MTRRRRVGTAAQASAQSVKIKLLEIGQRMRSEFVRPVKLQHLLGARVAFAYFGVVCAEAIQEFFVLAQERRFIEKALIPDDQDASTRLQNAAKLVAGRRHLKPVKRLPGRNEINGVGRQRGGFGGTRDAFEIRGSAQE